MENVFPKLPITYDSLKDACRKGLTSIESRCYWWPFLPQINHIKSHDERIEMYPDIVGVAERIHSLMSEPLLDYKYQLLLQSEDVIMNIELISSNLVQVLTKNEKIQDGYNIEPFLRILIREIQRVDVCYILTCEVINKRDKYLDASSKGHKIILYTFRELLKGYLPKTFQALNIIGALDDKYLNLIFLEFFVEILPERLVLTIFDAYLLEGKKVLLRYGLALIKGYKALIKSGRYSTAKDFWIAVKADAMFVSSNYNHLMLFKSVGLEESLQSLDPFLVFSNANNKEFLQAKLLSHYAYETGRTSIQKAYRPMRIDMAYLTKLKSQCMEVDTSPNQLNATEESSNVNSSTAMSRKSNPSQKKSISVTENIINERRLSLYQMQHPGSGSNSNYNVTQSTSRRRSSLNPTTHEDNQNPAAGEFDYLPAPAVPKTSTDEGKSMKPSKPMQQHYDSVDFKMADEQTPENKDSHDTEDDRLEEADDDEEDTEEEEEEEEEEDDDEEFEALNHLKRKVSSHPNEGSTAMIDVGMMAYNLSVAGMWYAKSEIIDETSAELLLSYLPPTVSPNLLDIVFTTKSHGFHLSSLYNCCQEVTSTILLIELEPPMQHVKIGAFLSGASMYPRGAFSVGDSLSFIFRLDQPHSAKFSSVILNQSRSDDSRQQPFENDATMIDNEHVMNGTKSPMNAEHDVILKQYATFTSSHMGFGGSQKFGTHAIRIDENLQYLITGESDTYGNPPLVRSESNSMNQFPIGIIEVFGYKKRHGK